MPSQNAIVMRGTTDQLMLAQKLIYDFDRARPEVVIDVAVLEVNRDKIRNLGITLPTSIGLTPQIPTSSTTTTGTTTSATNASSLNLNNLAHLNATDFAVSISGGTVNALLSDTDTRVLQNPRIRATDGQRATLKIGQKIPIATGSYNAGVSTGVASIGVQTQFTYLDVGVSIDITPTVHYDRDVTLKTDIQVSQQNGSQTISGVTEPIIGQRTLQNVIQLRDGEPSILAGILTKQDNKSVAGTPGLGEIPFFKFFFSSQNKEVQQDEIVFLLIPHIVRESVLTRANMAAIDTGTSRSIELRHIDAAQLAPMLPSDTRPHHRRRPPITAANAASAAIQQMHQQAMQPTPPPSTFSGAQPPSAPAAGSLPPSASASAPETPARPSAAPSRSLSCSTTAAMSAPSPFSSSSTPRAAARQRGRRRIPLARRRRRHHGASRRRQRPRHHQRLASARIQGRLRAGKRLHPHLQGRRRRRLQHRPHQGRRTRQRPDHAPRRQLPGHRPRPMTMHAQPPLPVVRCSLQPRRTGPARRTAPH